MEEGVSGQEIGLCLQPRTLLPQHRLELVQGVTTSIGDGGMRELPEALGGVQCRGRGGQAVSTDAQGCPRVAGT